MTISFRCRLTLAVAAATCLLISITATESFALQDGRRPTGRTEPATRDARGAQHGNTNAKPQRHFGVETPPPRTPGSIRIAAYNVLNLFDHVDDPALAGEYDDMLLAATDDRCRGLADAIRKVDADVISLEEVESLECVKWFRDTYLKDAGYKYICSHDVGYYRGVEQAVMSRIEITGSHVWPNDSLDHVKRIGEGFASPPKGVSLTFQRSPLLVDLRSENGYEFSVLAVHHKAGAQFDYHREAEALRIVEIISDMTAKNPSRNIIVMGDFNAAPWDKSLRIYLEAGMIDTMAHRTTQGDGEALRYKTHESNRVLDYILLNSAAHREFVIGSAFVLGTLVPPPSYDWRKDPHPPGYASDHYPIAIELLPEDRM